MNEASRQFLADLQGQLSQYFNGEEIETLAFVLGVDYDSLRGGTKPTKINSLIADLARRGRLQELIVRARAERGNIAWPDIPAGFELPQGAAGSESDGATIYQIGSLNTSGGAFIGGGVTAGGNVDAGLKRVAGDEIKGSKYVMSGDFRGAMLNIESRLENVTQTIGASAVPPDKKDQLTTAVNDLKQALSRISADQVQDAEALTRRVAALADEAVATNPDRDALADMGEIVRRAAGKLAGSVPGVIALVSRIIELVASITR